MEETEEETDSFILCRLCLQHYVDGRPLTGFISYKLKFIVPMINLDLSYDPKICNECIADLMAHYNFKSMCLDNNEPTHNFMELELLTQKNSPKSIYKRNEEKRKKCSLCHGKNNLGQLKESQVKLLRVMLERCLPDLEDLLPIICKNCFDALNNLFKFVNNCMGTEEKIKKYFNIKGLHHQSKINLDAMVQFIFNAEKRVEYIVSHADENVIDEATLGPTQISCDVAIKPEPVFDEPYSDVNMDIKCEPDIDIEEGPHREHLEDYVRKQSIVIDERSAENISIPPVSKKRDTEQATGYNKASLEAKRPKDSPVRDKQGNETTSENTQTKVKSTLTETSAPLFCSLCSFTAKKGRDIHRHITCTHKNLSGNKLYKCNMCEYSTNNKKLLFKHRQKNHELLPGNDDIRVNKKRVYADDRTHIETPGEDNNFQCLLCPYTANSRRNVRRHTKVSEVPVYSCVYCSYETGNKGHFNDHKLVHKTREEVPVYRCNSCPYWTKRRRDLPRHLTVMHAVKKSDAHAIVFGCEDVCE